MPLTIDIISAGSIRKSAGQDSTHPQMPARCALILALWLVAGCSAAPSTGADAFPQSDDGNCDLAADSPDTVSPSDLPPLSDPGPDLPEPVPDVPSDVPSDVPPDPGPGPDISIPATIGGDRPATVFVPDDYDPARKYPLVLLLHGQAMDGPLQDFYLGVSSHVTSHQFIEVLPNGTPDSDGYLFWNGTTTCCGYEGIEVDDIGYLTALIDEARSVLSVDPDRVYVAGHSNGGFMAFRLACAIADRIAGILSMAGALWEGTASCTPSKPVSILAISGTADDAVDYDGGSAWGIHYDGIEDTVAWWAAFDGCATPGVPGTAVDYDDDVDGPETYPTLWTGCDAGTSVELWRMEGTGHVPAAGEPFRGAIIEGLLAL